MNVCDSNNALALHYMHPEVINYVLSILICTILVYDVIYVQNSVTTVTIYNHTCQEHPGPQSIPGDTQ